MGIRITRGTQLLCVCVFGCVYHMLDDQDVCEAPAPPGHHRRGAGSRLGLTAMFSDAGRAVGCSASAMTAHGLVKGNTPSLHT
jgi:hypothetical protein